jgi:protein TonB
MSEHARFERSPRHVQSPTDRKTADASRESERPVTLSVGPLAKPAQRGSSLFAWIFGCSVVAHAPAALALARTYRPAHAKHVQEVDIEMTRPPEPPTPPPEPPPPPPVAAPPPQAPRVHLQAAPISAAPTAPLGDTPNVVATPGELAAPAPPPPAPPEVPAAPPPPPPPPPAPVVEAREGAHYRNNARPAYPRVALREGWEGTAVLRVNVLPDGHVTCASLLRSAGHSILDEAALAVVKSWLFDPATQAGRGIASVVTVPLQFKIQ